MQPITLTVPDDHVAVLRLALAASLKEDLSLRQYEDARHRARQTIQLLRSVKQADLTALKQRFYTPPVRHRSRDRAAGAVASPARTEVNA